MATCGTKTERKLYSVFLKKSCLKRIQKLRPQRIENVLTPKKTAKNEKSKYSVSPKIIFEVANGPSTCQKNQNKHEPTVKKQGKIQYVFKGNRK